MQRGQTTKAELALGLALDLWDGSRLDQAVRISKFELSEELFLSKPVGGGRWPRDRPLSMPSDAAATESPFSNPRGSKRGACDRCRGQKLRCLREDQSQDSHQAPCVRCFKAGATCSFGTPKRAGRPSTSHAASPQQRRGNGGGIQKEGGMASRPALNTRGHSGFSDNHADGGQNRRGPGGRGSGRLFGENTADQESEGETEGTTLAHALSPSSLHDTSSILGGDNFDFPAFSASSTATLPWPDETLPSFYNNDAGEASGFDPYGPKYSWAFHSYQAQPMDIQIPSASPMSNEEKIRDAAVNAYETPAQTYSTNSQLFGASDEAMDLDLPSQSARTAPFNPTEALNSRPDRAQDWHGERGRVSASFGMSSTAQSAPSKDLPGKEAAIRPNKENLSVTEFQHRRMQELSELAMDLYAQLAANDPKNHQPTSSATATAFQDQLVGSVLKSSNTFLTLLTSFSEPTAPSSLPSRPPPSTPLINHNDSTCNSSDSGTSPSASVLDQDDPAMDEAVRRPHRRLSAGSSDDSKPPPTIDMTTVLQLLTCYMRIIHLHSIMHAHILDYLLAFLPPATRHVDSVSPRLPRHAGRRRLVG
ncbi:hypothetical protein HO173_000199 [Letharia columbiana]|uniref:Zn(2)-C6 fungal-type domain-containing protein n=1 Tax=Letharia columbiana TaxID=112416 RepID=A0A8H6G6R4_9LECA|nr:uncharacterized protein HO173_000199 [Letharia columbiana]KAF6241489.1 hypothetical protein HO173_000199 [Letharia columbiana]